MEGVVSIALVVRVYGGVPKALAGEVVAANVEYARDGVDKGKVLVAFVSEFLELLDVVPAIDVVVLDAVEPFEEAYHPLEFASIGFVAGAYSLRELACKRRTERRAE